MEVGVAEAAGWLGVSGRRVQALAAAGRVPARRVGGSWLIDVGRLERATSRTRPMSPSVGAALLALLNDPTMHPSDFDLASSSAARLRHKLHQLHQDDDPASLLASWVAMVNPKPLRLSAQRRDLPALLDDARLVPTGISDVRANLAVSDMVEGWVAESDLDLLMEHFMLSTRGTTNVRLRVSKASPLNPTPFGQLLADLSAHGGPREGEAVKRLLRNELQ